MIHDLLAYRITAQLPFEPNEQKVELIQELGKFIASTERNKLFLLRGYAGTGKTNVVSAMVRALTELQQKTVLLAPTGRAAKVIAAYSGFPAYTIHKKIYRQQDMGTARFSLTDNLHKNTIFIVDEASMIANLNDGSSSFGTGRLLDDLVRYVYAGDHCSLLLLGDDAQLPPVGQTRSPALEKSQLEGYGLHVTEYQLTEVARQALESGILYNATRLRNRIAEPAAEAPLIAFDYPDIQPLAGNKVVEQIEQSYKQVGMEETLVVTRTNRRANIYNQGIRARILWKEDEISNADRLMVTRNNYYWTKEYEGIDFLANGDMFQILRLRKFRELYGFHFVDASLKAIDYDWEIDVILWLDTLYSDSPEAVYAQQQLLFERIAEDYPEIRSRKELVKTIIDHPYYNALQVKFSYAVTCHKAQGGQWKHVYIDQGTLTDEQKNIDYYRWLYTAITRASEQVYLINFEN